MPNADEIYATAGNFMKGDDFKDCDPVTFTIAKAEIMEFTNRETGQVQRKVVLDFEETDQRLVLNNTRRLAVQEAAGSSQTEQWVGTKITLYGTKATYGSKLYNVIGVEQPKKKATGKLPRFVAKKMFDEHEPPPHDEIPDEGDPIPF